MNKTEAIFKIRNNLNDTNNKQWCLDLCNVWDIDLLDACEMGFIEIVELLIEAGEPANGDNLKPVYMAILHDHPEILERLIIINKWQHAQEICSRLLEYACEYNSLGSANKLLGFGASIYGRGNRPLRHASQLGYIKIVELLLEAGADVHADDETALCRAVQYGHVEIVKLLLEAGADVHIDDDWLFNKALEHQSGAVLEVLESYR